MLIKNLTYLTAGYLCIQLANGRELRSLVEPVCTLEKGVNYLGNDIGQKPSPTPEGCCDLCNKQVGCHAFTWNKFNGGMCFFKAKKDKVVEDPSCSSSTVSGVEPQPTCQVEKGVNIVGGDIGKQSCSSSDKCCDLCTKFPGCKAWTWSKENGGTCWFKSKKAKVTPDGSCDSSVGVVTPEDPKPTCNVEQGIEYLDNDVGNVPATEPCQCFDKCKAFKGCTVFTWTEWNGGTCWLKSKKDKTKQDPSCTSAVVTNQPPVDPQPTCKVEKGVNIVGGDIGSKECSKSEECCALCDKFPGCKAFTWSKHNGGTCWFKSKKAKVVPDDSCDSSVGTVVEDPPVDPQPTCKLLKGFNIIGCDIGSKNCVSSDKCCELCDKFPGCKAWTWSKHNGGTCWFKNKQGQTVVDASCDSSAGVVVDPPVDPEPTCKVEKDVDYVDNDIGNVPAAKACDCVDKCKAFKGCKAFSWNNHAGGTCWLKSKKDKTVSKPGVYSLVVDSSVDPVPTCSLEKDVDYVDNDVGNVPATKACDCVDKCKAFKGCKAFSWSDHAGGTCWLKSKKDKTVPKPGVHSLVVDTTVDPDPQPTCKLEKNVDYVDNDVGNVPAAKACDCHEKCKAFKGCQAFSWSSYSGGTCWLKSKKDKTVPKDGVWSSAVDTPNQGCSLENGVDYIDNDVGNVPASSACDCTEKCKAFKGCKAFTWTNYSGGTCWLKSKKDKWVPNVYAISWVVDSTPSESTCKLEQNVDYVDNDIGNSPGKTAGECCDKCKAFNGCKAFSWSNHNGGTCWFKSKKDKWVTCVGVTSSVL